MPLLDQGGSVTGTKFTILFFPFNNFIHLFKAMLVLHCCMGFSLVAASRGLLLVAVCRLGAVASLIVKPGL